MLGCWFLLSFHEKRIPPLQSNIRLHFHHILMSSKLNIDHSQQFTKASCYKENHLPKSVFFLIFDHLS